MLRTWLKITLIAALVIILAACASSPPAPTSTTPPPTVEQAEPAAEDAETEDEDADSPAIDAAAIYGARCAGCHGADRSGNNGPALLPERLTKSASAYVTTITDGSGGMPAFGNRLSADEISALVDFILSEPQ